VSVPGLSKPKLPPRDFVVKLFFLARFAAK
jgi:hypothetical protein